MEIIIKNAFGDEMGRISKDELIQWLQNDQVDPGDIFEIAEIEE